MSRARRRPIPHPANWARRRTRKDHWCGWIWIRSSSMPPTTSGFTRRWVIRSRSVWRASANAVRARLGEPLRVSYGPGELEKLDIYRARKPNAPIFLFVHGGSWRGGSARNNAYPAEMFVNAGANFIAIDFIDIKKAGGDLRLMAAQVRSAIAWVYKNAAYFGDADANRLYIGGRSSGAHLTAVALVTDWERDHGVPADVVKGGICSSGMYDLKPVRLSKRSSFVRFTDEMEQAMSPQR